MRSFSEEKRSGVDELLFTSPVKTTGIVAGKFIANFYFYMILLILTLHFPYILMKFGNPEKGPILTGYIGLILLGTAYIVFGMFASSLTKNQIVAGAISFVGLLLFWLIGILSGKASGIWKEVLSYITIIDHFQDLTKGPINTQDIVFFLSFIFIFLFFTKMSLDSLRWR